MSRRKPKNQHNLSRKKPKREPYNRVLIVCEGKKTEPYYFSDLRNHYGLSTANIAVTPANGSDPISIVKYAKKCQQDEKKQGEQFDRIYCVFDRDEHINFSAACDQIVANGFQSVRSWPCFEYWLLLHFSYHRKPFLATQGRTAAQYCQSVLKTKMPTYLKGEKSLFSTLLNLSLIHI